MTLAPLRAFVWSYERLEEWIEKEVGKRLEGVAPERIQQPPAHVVVPALTAVAYTQADELRAMFASLLAKSMDGATARDVHPSFVEVIKQLTPDEAKILSVLGEGAAFYEVCYYDSYVYDEIVVKSSGPHSLVRDVTDLFDRAGCPRDLSSVAVDNIVRQNLAQFTSAGTMADFSNFLKDVDAGRFSVLDAELLQVIQQRRKARLLHVEVRYLEPTSYGEKFCACCIH